MPTFKTKFFTATEILYKEKKKCPNAKSLFEYIKKNEATDILEKQVEEYLDQMINRTKDYIHFKKQQKKMMRYHSNCHILHNQIIQI